MDLHRAVRDGLHLRRSVEPQHALWQALTTQTRLGALFVLPGRELAADTARPPAESARNAPPASRKHARCDVKRPVYAVDGAQPQLTHDEHLRREDKQQLVQESKQQGLHVVRCREQRASTRTSANACRSQARPLRAFDVQLARHAQLLLHEASERRLASGGARQKGRCAAAAQPALRCAPCS